jgi:hypothetical protein
MVKTEKLNEQLKKRHNVLRELNSRLKRENEKKREKIKHLKARCKRLKEELIAEMRIREEEFRVFDKMKEMNKDIDNQVKNNND